MSDKVYNNFLDDLIVSTIERVSVDKSVGEYDKIPYAIGTFDNNGNPTQKKVKRIRKAILKGYTSTVVVEGGVRGGKDIHMLKIWSEYLMLSTEKLHLALGSTYEHALNTIYESNGFGLKYLIPHGTFERTTEKGAVKGIFSFLNIYGEPREVHFYGNTKTNDHKKFQGLSYGSAYLNEAINQHLNGINEAFSRVMASKEKLIIMTQNPLSSAHPFYREIEEPKLLNNELIEYVMELKKNKELISKFKTYYLEHQLKLKKAFKKYSIEYLKSINKKDLEELTDAEKEIYERGKKNIKLQLNLGSEYNKVNEKDDTERIIIYGLYNVPLKNFIEIPKKILKINEDFGNLSIYKILNYYKGAKNPNGIVNGIDYTYVHFTNKDNLGMNEMQRNSAGSDLDKSSAKYKQRILGERVSSDNMLLPEFTDRNVLTQPIEFYEQNPNTLRVIAIDPGYDHPTGITDAEVDLEKGIVYVLQDAEIDMKKEISNENEGISRIDEELFKIIRARKERKKPDVLLVDPSATYLVKHYERLGFNIQKVDNSTNTPDSKELTFGDKTLAKGIKGIDLFKAALFHNKLFVHQDCVPTISTWQGMSVKFNEKTGKDDIIKLRDELFDTTKYILNTMGISPAMWDVAERMEEYERKVLQTDGSKKEKKWNMESARERIERKKAELRSKREYSTKKQKDYWRNKYGL